ncbi:DUF2207 domain-containing protein [Devosia psychrophila]|uniref:Uncharacterized membrane protein n=1 Tax=Devosia psychrophila TaxID=728005 RepID=A0A1I1P9T0_9HYPH|nr:DUF2207 domain-containing protein [Devosia psychrophila]SFD06342.1 Uncharacterized membrane protein [Devosia psychrophila]
MRLFARAVIALLLGLLLAVPSMAREEISSLASNVTLRTDGSVRVSEAIEVNAEGVEIRRGIYRDIPIVQLSMSGQKIRSDLNVESVTRDGADEPFRTERMGNFVRIWIGDSEQFISDGKHRYVITYTMDRMARSFEDHDELYWNATGNYWIFPIVRSEARVTLPDGAVISDLAGYTGAVGSTEQAVTVTRNPDNTASFRTDRQLGAGEGMSFAVKFQKGILVPLSGTDAFFQWLSDMREVFLPILGVILVLGYNILAWNRVGRDPAKGTIIPLFHPPKDFSPALTHYVDKWGFHGWTAFTATLFDLGVKGLVKIDNPKTGLTVEVTGKVPEGKLPAGEQKLFTYLQSKGTVTVDTSNGAEIAKQRDELHGAITSENRSVWFNHNFGYAVLGLFIALAVLAIMVFFEALEPEWLIIGVIVGIVLGIVGTVGNALWKGGGFRRFFVMLWIGVIGFNLVGSGLEGFTHLSVNTSFVAASSIVLITVIFAILMRAPTIQGRKVMDQIEGFKLYLDTAEKNRLNIVDEPPMTVGRFERILPYAIALGVEKPWSEHFEGELARNAVSDVAAGSIYQPYWYSGRSDFSPGNISNAISAASAGMTAAMVAAQPVQASSSGFSSGGGGGGSSGGGGGGGGGGGW